MPRALVVFDAHHRATRLAAEEIARGITEAAPLTATISCVEELSAEKVAACRIVVLGCSGSAREAARELEQLSARVSPVALVRKTVSVFDAGVAGQHGPGARQLRASLLEAAPALHLAAPGISVAVVRRQSGLAEEEAVRCRQFGEHLAEIALAAGSP